MVPIPVAVLPKWTTETLIPAWFLMVEIGRKSLVCYVDSEIRRESREGWVGNGWNHSPATRRDWNRARKFATFFR